MKVCGRSPSERSLKGIAMPDANAISLESTVVVAQNLVSSELGGEVVIMDLRSGVYLGLNATGAVIWNLAQQPRKVSEIRDAILKEYDVERERCELDLLAVLGQMAGKGLLEVLATPHVAIPA
jgi:hypothetical protein